jgi:hypothetical protein
VLEDNAIRAAKRPKEVKREAARKWRSTQDIERQREKARNAARRYAEECTLAYARSLLVNNNGVPRKYIPQELVEVKRLEILIKRKLKESHEQHR